MPSHRNVSRGIRAVALVEAAKAILVLLAGFGLLALIHRDVHALAEKLFEHMHLNPARRYPRIFIDAASKLTDARLWMMATFAFLYASFRAIEAYGLWRERAWAEWFALVTGAVYLPVELYELALGITWIKVGAIMVNIGIVAYMAYAIRIRRIEAH
jgi:uncharacterized membrane protein (DUF2068 family)